MTLNPNNRLAVQMKISTLWIVALFNNTFRDIHEFLRAGYMDWLLEATTNGATDVSPTLLLGSALFYQIPIGMIFLTQALSVKVSRWANAIGASIFIVGIVAGSYVYPFPPDLDDMIFFGVSIAAMFAIILYALRWKQEEA